VTTVAAPARLSPATTARTVSGTGVLLRFMLRRERFRLPWWLLGTGLLMLVQSAQSQSIYSTPEELAQLRATLGGNVTVIALSGPEELLDTIGGEVVFEIFGFLAIVVALMTMFLVGRHTRSDEETGRAELVRSAQVGRHAPLAAALCLAGLASLAAAVVVFAAAAGTGLPVGGSILVGVATAGVGLVFAALTAVAAQVFENTRAVYGAVGLALGASYMLRAAGDVGNGVLSWLSPIGWGQRTFPYSDDRWWPLVLPLVAGALAVGAAVALLDRRDFGAGLLPSRPGRATASRALDSPLGLAWRLQRGSLIGWAVGLSLLGAAYGSLGNTMEQFIADNPEVADFLPGGAADVVDSFLALTISMSALLTAAFGVSSALRARGEETSGRAEPVLATGTSRWAWLGSHLSVALGGGALVLLGIGFGEGLAYGLTASDAGQIPRMMAVALVYLPAVWAVIGLAVLAIGWLPRAAAVVAWVAVGYCAVVALFAESFDLPAWFQNASPFAHTPQAPLESVAATPLLVVGAVALVLLAAGFVGFRRRDAGY
jgi:ABC-2 type transport system permease protein